MNRAQDRQAIPSLLRALDRRPTFKLNAPASIALGQDGEGLEHSAPVNWCGRLQWARTPKWDSEGSRRGRAPERLDAALPIRCTSAPGDSETPMLNMTELELRLVESHLAHTGACSESAGDSELPWSAQADRDGASTQPRWQCHRHGVRPRLSEVRSCPASGT